MRLYRYGSYMSHFHALDLSGVLHGLGQAERSVWNWAPVGLTKDNSKGLKPEQAEGIPPKIDDILKIPCPLHYQLSFLPWGGAA